MTDEALYQQAADELNSARRRPHVWARACELANDDHDEARFLYTSLRVEELLAEADGPGTATDGTDEDRTEAGERSSGREPSLSSPGTDVADDGSADSTVHASTGLDAPAEPRPLADDGEPAYDGRRPAGTDDVATASDDDTDETRRLDPHETPNGGTGTLEDGSFDDGSRELEALSTGTGAVEDAFWSEAESPADERSRDGRTALEADVLPAPTAPASGALDDLDWLDEAYREERRTLAAPPPAAAESHDDTDELTRELRRQADELPGGRGEAAVIDHHDDGRSVAAAAADDRAPDGRVTDERAADGHASDEPVPDGRTSDGAAPDAAGPFDTGAASREPEEPGRGTALAGAASGALAASRPSASGGDAADPPSATPNASTSADEPLELADDGAGDEEYAVFSRDGGRRWQAVRQGGSWAATLFTLPWLLHRHLVGTAILYALLAATVIAGLLVTGFAWRDAGADASLATRAAAIGFALLAAVGLFVVPFRFANHWREDKLEARGFELVAYVRARGAARATELARRASRSVG